MFRTIVGGTAHPFVVLAPDGTIRYAGESVETVVGWKPVDLVGRNMVEFLAPADVESAIEAIEPLGLELPLYDITTGTGDFIANGVISHNCFARPTHAYLNLNIGDDFDSKIVVKVNAVERTRAEIASSRWSGSLIAMGTNTDPYQRSEGNTGSPGGSWRCWQRPGIRFRS